MELRFNDHREITARHDGPATCGHGQHTVKAGDRIGYARPRYGAASVVCAECWARWAAENRECDYLER